MLHLLAQISPDLWPRLLELGVAGPLIYWIAVRLERAVQANTTASILMAKSQMLTLISLRHLDGGVREQAMGHLRDIEKKFPTPYREGEKGQEPS